MGKIFRDATQSQLLMISNLDTRADGASTS